METVFWGIVLVLGIAVVCWHFSRSETILREWAARSGYRIVSSERRWLRRGPFFWFTSDGQVVFYVVVEDDKGVLRQGYVRCGSWWFGLLTPKAEVRWDD